MHLLKKSHPAGIIIVSYLIAIILGGTLLWVPFSQNSGVEQLSFLNCIFTATSALCVTGLVVVPTAVQWSSIGQVVILLLIQIGGLGVITIRSYIFILIGKKLNYSERILAQNSLNQEKVGGILKLTKFTVYFSLIFELIGGFLLWVHFYFIEQQTLARSIFNGIFHSVSAFCNAGFDILGTNSVVGYSSNWYICTILMVLIFFGGIGFLVWYDLWLKVKNKNYRVSLTSKIALISSVILIILGFTYFMFAEYSNPGILGNMDLNHKILSSLFQSVTLRTAGFANLDQFALREPSKFFSSILMLIGGSPGSIAGGIKTVTVAVIFLSIISIVRGKSEIQVNYRTIPMATFQKSVAIAFIYLFLAFSFSMLLYISEQQSTFDYTFVDLFYECSSALATVGLTTGITPFLSVAGRCIIIVAMYMGRVGPLTILKSFVQSKNNSSIKYPDQDVSIG